MHDLERPTALSATFLANKGRDPKKNKMINYLDLSFYKPRNGSDGADAVYGSAMMTMAKRRTLPSWALFCFKDVTSGASSDYVPEVCAFVAKDAMLLHPIKVDGGWEGMLIALESASEQKRTFVADNGEEYELFVPLVHTKAIAEEGVVLS